MAYFPSSTSFPAVQLIWIGYIRDLGEAPIFARVCGSIGSDTITMTIDHGGRPLTLSDGSPLTLRFEVDMGKTPPLFRKGYLSGLGCVPDIART